MHAKACRLNVYKLAAAKEELASMGKLSIIRRSNSPWASPLSGSQVQWGLPFQGLPPLEWHHKTRLCEHGLILLPCKVEAVQQLTRPTTVRALQEFLGMVNFDHNSSPGLLT